MPSRHTSWFLGAILTAALVSSCGDGGSSPIVPDEEPSISKDQFLREDKVLGYFVAQSDAEKPDFVPAQMHREVIKSEEVAEVKDKFWSLWRRANEKAMTEIGFDNSSKLLTLDLPQDEKMKVRCIPRAEKPAEGYPLIIHLHGGGRYPNEPGPWTSTLNEEEWLTHLEFCRNRYPNDPSYFLDFRGLKTSDRTDRMMFEVQKEGNTYDITTQMLKGTISGKIALFIDRIEQDKPVIIRLNGKTVHDRKVRATRGAIAESIALYGDPKRIYSSRVEIEL